jgi:hypothetical protein
VKEKKQKQTPKPSSPKKKAQAIHFLSDPQRQKTLLIIGWLFPAVIIISFFNSLYKHSINFPYYDDFEAILNFLTRYITHPAIGDRIRLLFEQHSEHRLVFDRVIALLEYYLLPEINFKSFILIGHAGLAVALIMLYKSFRLKQRHNIIYLLPVAAIIFNFRYFETSFWPMAAMQNLWVLSFALASLYCLHKETKYSFYFSILFGWLAAFTSANGMMTFVAGAFVLLTKKELLKRKHLIWFGCGLLAMGAYFYHYTKPPAHPPILQPMLDNPAGFLGYALAFLGGAFSDDMTIAIIIGISLVCFAVFITWRKYYEENPVIYSFIVFLLITSVLAALARLGFGVGQALSSKYAVNSAVLTSACYIALVSLVQKRIRLVYLIALTGLAVYFHFGTYAKYLPAKAAEKEEFERNYALVAQGKLSHFNYGWPALDERKELPKRELKAADSLGYFKFKFTEEAELIEKIPAGSGGEIKFKIERYERVRANAIVMSGWAFAKRTNSDDVLTILCYKDILGNPKKYFICQKIAHQDITQANASDNTNYDSSGFVTLFNPKEVSPGKYRLAIIITDGTTKTELDTGQVVEM